MLVESQRLQYTSIWFYEAPKDVNVGNYTKAQSLSDVDDVVSLQKMLIKKY